MTDDGVFSSDGDEPLVWQMHGHVRRGYLGVRLLEMTPELRAHYGAPKDAGVLVAGVESESPASKAGIQVGDIVTRAGGERIESASDLTHAVRPDEIGETLKLEVSRDRAVKQLAVKIEERRSAEIDLGELGHDLGEWAASWAATSAATSAGTSGTAPGSSGPPRTSTASRKSSTRWTSA